MKPSAERVLEYLRSHGGRATTSELCSQFVGGVRFSARVAELRHDYGFEIRERRIRAGASEYTLIESSMETDGKASPRSTPVALADDPPPPTEGGEAAGGLFDAAEFEQRPGYADREAA